MNDDVYQVVTTINGEIKYAEEAYQVYKDKGLIFSAMEAEGYLRACLTIKDELSEWHENFRDAFNSDPDS